MFGIGPHYYLHIYTLLVTVMSLFVFIKYPRYSQDRIITGRYQSSFEVVIITIIMMVFIGLRPISGRFFVDMANYARDYNLMLGQPFEFEWNTDNKLFDNLFAFLASNSLPVEVFFLLIAVIYFGGISFACSRLFPRDKIASVLVYLGAFSTFSYGTNGIKAGAAASLFLVALALYRNRQWIWVLVFLLLSLGFHHSMIMPVLCFIVCLFVRDSRLFFVFWIICLLIAAFHITLFQEFFGSIVDEQGAGYLLGEDYIRKSVVGGFRIDFILYSAVPIFVGGIAVFRKKNISRQYAFLLCLYTMINSVWLLCMYAEFTNRIAYLSWLMLPIVLIYPFLNEKWGKSQYKTFHWVALGHLAFTLFMQYVYY